MTWVICEKVETSNGLNQSPTRLHPIDRPQKYIYDKYNKFPNIINDVPVFNFLIKYVTFIYFF